MHSVFGRAVIFATVIATAIVTVAFSATSYAAGRVQLTTANAITIQSKSGQPIAGATILLGFEPGNPFEGNLIITDGSGLASIPADWKADLPVTVQAAGFVSQTIPLVTPGELTVTLSTQESATEFEVAGETTDFGRLRTDGKVDFGLVIPAVDREKLLGFDLSTVISPKTDTIEIIGNEINLPSNLTLPEQTENYIFVGSSRVDLQACKLEYSIVSPK